MSSKGRKTGDEPPNENYPTEPWVVKALLDELPLSPTTDQLWLEPCAGEGAILNAVHDWCGQQPFMGHPPTWDCVEIREDGFKYLDAMRVNRTCPLSISEVHHANFLTWEPPVPLKEGCLPEKPYDVVITNPPFSIAMEVIQKSFQLTDGHVIMLQRLNFLGSKKRAPFWWKYPPDVYVLGMNRPSFKTDGRTDSIEYGWFVWPPGERQRPCGNIRVLRGGRPNGTR